MYSMSAIRHSSWAYQQPIWISQLLLHGLGAPLSAQYQVLDLTFNGNAEIMFLQHRSFPFVLGLYHALSTSCLLSYSLSIAAHMYSHIKAARFLQQHDFIIKPVLFSISDKCQ